LISYRISIKGVIEENKTGHLNPGGPRQFRTTAELGVDVAGVVEKLDTRKIKGKSGR
jgi:hypothetical protein